MEKKIIRKKVSLTKSNKEPEKALPKVKKVLVKKEKDPAGHVVVLGLHNLSKPKGAARRKKILGRGPSSGHGKTSTRGSKGQTSRAGRDFYPGFEGGQTPLIRRMPKRGFTSKFKKIYQVVNLGNLNAIKETEITLQLLEEHGLIRNKAMPVKILGDGELKKTINIRAHAFSRQASEKIQKAGGKAEIINEPIS